MIRIFCVLVVAAVSGPLTAFGQTPTFSRADFASRGGARGVATADFNRDGWPDVAHANTGRDTVTVLLNQRTASGLAFRADIPVGHGPFDIVTADFNRDGTPDLAVANADSSTISILIGNGSGGFTRSDLAAPGNPRGITAADLNADAKPDIVYTAYLHNRVQVLDGNGAGGFSVGWSVVGVANAPQGVAAADFNHDGRVDLAVAYARTDGGLAMFYRQAPGNFLIQRIAGEPSLNVVSAADLNRDGWADVVAASTGNNRLAVYVGGSAGISHRATFLTGSSPRGIAVADLNQDGLPEILAANKESNTLSLFTARASGGYVASELAAGRGSRGVVAADFDHDGLPDLATGNQDESSVTVLWNSTALAPAGFAFRKLDGSYGFEDYHDEVALGDFDEDGRLDRITSAGAMFFGNGAERQLPGAVPGVVVAEVNGDGHLDLVFLQTPRRAVSTLLGDGLGGFTPGGDASGWSSTETVTDIDVADVNRDGKADVLVSAYVYSGNTSTGFFHVMKGNGNATFQAPSTMSMPAVPWFWTGDVDGDAKIDLLL